MIDSTAIAPAEDFGSLGPAMQRLTERQRAFVVALVTGPVGVGCQTRAYRLAGYKGSGANQRKEASKLIRQEQIVEAIAEESKKVFRIAFPEAVGAALSIIRDPNHKDHGRVVMGMIDRFYPAQTQHSIDVVHRTVDPDREALEELRAARELGATREKLVSLFGENALDRLTALEALDNAQRSIAAKMIDGKATEQ